MRRSREVSPCHDVKRAKRIPDVHEWKILGKGTHGEIFASPDVDEVAVKRFCTRTASRYAICHLKSEDPECEPVIEPISVSTNREAKYQELARSAAKHLTEILNTSHPRPHIPKLHFFEETESHCFVGMQRLYPPPGKKSKLIQINTAEKRRNERDSQGHYMGVDELEEYLRNASKDLTILKVLEDVATLYASMHFVAHIDAYDVEFVLAGTTPNDTYFAVCAIDFDKVQLVDPEKPTPYCICRKIAEGRFVPHYIRIPQKMFAFLASAITSSGVVPRVTSPLRKKFVDAYIRAGNAAILSTPPSQRRWTLDAPRRVIAALDALMDDVNL